ncbi:hypothetical protein PENTCL1PPCAC_2588 [Pristionchus entomophagus]|uniref:Apple domain-containing protein n=1 Tax=Pristionchus entomophagus TaxID=358040 RepID=A0AAV5SIC3_9BILA|nr:hypothetical protein PENTCL1PPCAC_2588 [Pristionchus entomophagus]
MQLLYLLLPLAFLVEGRKNPLDCFVVSTEHALLGTAFSAPRVPNLHACLRQCLRRTKCRSLLYYRSKNVCVLNSKTRDEKKSGFVSTEGLAESSDYYERICYDRPRAVARAANTAKECFTVESGKVLIGIVDQQIKNVKTLEKCMRACQDSKRKSDRVCKSAMYYEKEQECILASQNKGDSPDLYIEDENSVYLENACFTEERETATMKIGTVNTTTASSIVLDSTPQVEIEDVPITTTESPATTTVTTAKPTGKPKQPDHLVHPELIPLPTMNAEPPPVESSGYVIAPQYTVTKNMGAVRKSEIIPPYIVDSYGVERKRDQKKPVKTNKSEPAQLVLPPLLDLPSIADPHTRRLRHPAVKDCFSEISAVDPGTMTGRVVKAYSLEQCVDICRLCNRCLRRKPCLTVAFHEEAYSCGLSSESAESQNEPLSRAKKDTNSIVFFVRGHC